MQVAKETKMTNLSDFLKVEKVRCVSKNAEDNLTIGKEYKVTHIIFGLQSDNNSKGFYDFDSFEPVLDSAENAPQNMKLTPEFEVVEPVLADNSINIQDIGTDILDTNADIKDTPKFKVGDKVYFPNMAGGEILTLLDNKACHYPFFVNVVNAVNNSLYELDSNGKTKYGNFTDFAVKATPENYELLCKLYRHIEFEQPAKELKGSDLCRAMLDKGWVSVPCYISDESDYEADNNAFCVLIGKFDKCFKELDTNYEHEYAVPFDPRTGEPLTEAALDE